MSSFHSPVVNSSARTAVMTEYVLMILSLGGTQFFVRLYADLVTDSLTEFSHDADMAGLSNSLQTHSTGLYVSMIGYNDKIFVLADTLLDNLKTLVGDPRRLEIMKESVCRSSSSANPTHILIRPEEIIRISSLVDRILSPTTTHGISYRRHCGQLKKDWQSFPVCLCTW